MNIQHFARTTVVTLILILAAAATAASGDGHMRMGDGHMRVHDETGSRLRQELAGIVEDHSDTPLGELTVNELFDIAGQLSIREQEGRYIERKQRRSFMLPGLGQFGTGDPLAGSLFLGGHVALKAGTLTGAYMLLPDEVRPGNDGLDYAGDSFADIRDTWRSLSFSDIGPSLGVLAGGGLVQTAYRFWSASDAGARATRNVEEGTVRFEPQPFMFVGDRLGFGASLKY